MSEIFNEDKMQYLCGQVEVGEKKTEHWQAFVQFKTKQRTTAVVKFFPSKQWHHEVMRGTVQQAVDYTRKEPREQPWEEHGDQPSTSGKCDQLDKAIEMAMTTTTNKSIALEYPRVYVLHGKKLEHFRRVIRTPEPELKYPLDAFPWTPITDWSTSWVLWGKPGTGKTSFAKAHFSKPLLVSHIDQLKSFDGHDGIIFDDMDFCHWPRGSQIHLVDVDEPRGINVKHDMIVIPAGVKKIFTTNEDEGDIFIDDDAVNRRVEWRELVGMPMGRPIKKRKRSKNKVAKALEQIYGSG